MSLAPLFVSLIWVEHGEPVVGGWQPISAIGSVIQGNWEGKHFVELFHHII